MEVVAAVVLSLAAAAFGVHAWRKRSLVWAGVALLVAGVYAVPVVFVALR